MSTYDARDLNLSIDSKKIKTLYKTKSYKHALDIAFDWLVIIVAIILCLQFLNPLSYILAVIVIGSRMHALAILMHDATHYRFLKNRKMNDLITNIVSMYPIFTSIETYRQNHLRHHMHLNTEHDPDWVAKLGKQTFTFPKSKREFLMTILSYFTMYSGISDAIWFLKRFSPQATKNGKKKKKEPILPRILFYVVLFAAITVFGWWKYYLAFWIVPYLSTFFMFQYIRSVAEHFGDLEYDHLLTATRSVKVNPFEAFIFAPHNVGYHIEHHLYPGVPYYNLDKLHDLLMSDQAYRSKAHVTHGYVTGLLNDLGSLEELAMVSGNSSGQLGTSQ